MALRTYHFKCEAIAGAAVLKTWMLVHGHKGTVGLAGGPKLGYAVRLTVPYDNDKWLPHGTPWDQGLPSLGVPISVEEANFGEWENRHPHLSPWRQVWAELGKN